MTAKRPRRKKLADEMLHGQMPRRDIAVDYAIAPMDRLASQMDDKWGIDKLPELVSPETATRYGHAMSDLNEAIATGDETAVAATAANCMRGLQAMDREAEAAGAPKARGLYREYDVDGFRFGILDDDREWPIAKAARPDLKFYTLRDIGCALRAMEGVTFLDDIREHFPNAQPTKLPKLTGMLARGGDDLPPI